MHVADAVSGAPKLIWDEFNTIFVDKFLPKSVREIKGYKFERLVQTPNMIAAEYDVKFTKLSLYAIYLNLTDDEKTKWFVKRLVHPLFRSWHLGSSYLTSRQLIMHVCKRHVRWLRGPVVILKRT